MSSISLDNVALGDLAERARQAWMNAHLTRSSRCDTQRRIARLQLSAFRHDPNPHIRAIACPGQVERQPAPVIDPDGGLVG